MGGGRATSPYHQIQSEIFYGEPSFITLAFPEYWSLTMNGSLWVLDLKNSTKTKEFHIISSQWHIPKPMEKPRSQIGPFYKELRKGLARPKGHGPMSCTMYFGYSEPHRWF